MITAKEEKGWREEVQTMADEELFEVLRRKLTHPDARQVIRDELLMRLVKR